MIPNLIITFLSFLQDSFTILSILFADLTIARIIAELNPRCSISFKPEIVIPFGVVTLSISDSGYISDSRVKEAAPLAVWAASKIASST